MRRAQRWASEPLDVDPSPSLTLTWLEPIDFRELMVIFDDEVDEDLINLHHHETPFEGLPGPVCDYRAGAGRGRPRLRQTPS